MSIDRDGLTIDRIATMMDIAQVGANVTAYGALGDGVTDDTAAILTALAAEDDVFLPPGTYVTTDDIVIAGQRLYGVPGLSIIKPSAAVAKCIDLRGNGVLQGIYLDGVNTSGKTGLDVGSAGAVNLPIARDVQIWHFAGSGGRGIRLASAVTAYFENCYVCQNAINVHTGGSGGTPTDSLFMNCQFREATTKGLWVEHGYELTFLKCLFESNGEEGAYLQGTGAIAVEIGFLACWLENNWTSVSAGALRHAKYQFLADAATGPADTIRPWIRDCKFDEASTSARAIHLTNATGFCVDNVKVADEAGQILVDGTSYGGFPYWQPQSGSFGTTVTNTSGGAANDAAELAAIKAAWIDWTPGYTCGGAMTFGTVTGKARYRIVGKTLEVIVNVSGTTGGTAAGSIYVSLPTGARTKDANTVASCLIGDGGLVMGVVSGDGTSPTSSLYVVKADGANWGLGAGRTLQFTYVCDLY